MFVGLLLFSSSFLGFELVCYFTGALFNDFTKICVGICLGFYLISFLSLFLFKFQQISRWIIFEEVLLFCVLGFRMRKLRRNVVHFDKILTEFLRSFSLFFVSILLVKFCYFYKNRYVSTDKYLKFIGIMANANSFVFGNNTGLVKYNNALSFVELRYFDQFLTLISTMMLSGSTFSASTQIVLIFGLFGFFVTLRSFASVFSQYKWTFFVSFFVFIMSECGLSLKSLSSYDVAASMCLYVFGVTALVIAVFDYYRASRLFFFVGFLLGFLFYGNIDMFYSFMLLIFSVLIHTFPYLNGEVWDGVFIQYLNIFFGTCSSAVPVAFFIELVSVRSVYIDFDIHRVVRDIFGVFVTNFLPVCLVLSLILFDCNKQSIFSSCLLLAFFMCMVINKDAVLKVGFVIKPFGSVILAHILLHLSKKLKTLSKKSIVRNFAPVFLIFLVCIRSFCRQLSDIRSSRKDVMNEESYFIYRFASRYTSKDSSSLRLLQSDDPFSILAGRKSPAGSKDYIMTLNEDIPRLKRTVYIFSTTYESFSNAGITYLTVSKEPKFFSPLYESTNNRSLFIKLLSLESVVIYKHLQ